MIGLMWTSSLSHCAVAQSKPDSSRFLSFLKEPGHSPTKAAFFAALIPSGGQIYNRKYWKIPIAVTGYAGAVVYFKINHDGYKQSKSDYLALTDTLPETVYEGGESAAVLLNNINDFRRNRDLGALLFLAWHGLCIIDANVDAHLLTWDVNEDLSFRVRPALFADRKQFSGVGVSINLTW